MTIPDRLRKRLAPLLLAGGAAAAAIVVVPSLPHEHRVDLRLDDAASVTGVQLAWASVEAPAGDDAVRGSSWHFQPGSAPRTVGASVSLPNGRYALDVVVERGPGVETFHRVVTLGDAEHITVPLRSDAR